jgi:hypothetical protein
MGASVGVTTRGVTSVVPLNAWLHEAAEIGMLIRPTVCMIIGLLWSLWLLRSFFSLALRATSK